MRREEGERGIQQDGVIRKRKNKEEREVTDTEKEKGGEESLKEEKEAEKDKVWSGGERM